MMRVTLYIVSRTVFKLLRNIGQIIGFDRGASI